MVVIASFLQMDRCMPFFAEEALSLNNMVVPTTPNDVMIA